MDDRIARLTTIAQEEDLEAWWHPLWTFKLLPYLDADYLGTTNLSICPQPALRDKVTGGFPYIFPDFAMIQSYGGEAGGAPVGRNLHLVMENKRTESVAWMGQAQFDCEFYMAHAICTFNHPANLIYFVATAGKAWTWRKLEHQGNGEWAWTTDWEAGGYEGDSFTGYYGPLNI